LRRHKDGFRLGSYLPVLARTAIRQHLLGRCFCAGREQDRRCGKGRRRSGLTGPALSCQTHGLVSKTVQVAVTLTQ
jgi:hypothetical protein